MRLGVPGCPARQSPGIEECRRPHSDQGIQTQQCRGGAPDGAVRPLALGLDPEMSAALGEGDFDLLAADEIGQDHRRIELSVGAEEGLRLVLAGRIAHQDPA
jgi:hypothetical protein